MSSNKTSRIRIALSCPQKSNEILLHWEYSAKLMHLCGIRHTTCIIFIGVLSNWLNLGPQPKFEPLVVTILIKLYQHSQFEKVCENIAMRIRQLFQIIRILYNCNQQIQDNLPFLGTSLIKQLTWGFIRVQL